MAQYLSEDLQVRVIRAVEGGMSRNAAARRFGVSIASAVRWVAEYLGTDRTGAEAARRRPAVRANYFANSG
jgi:transposase